MCSKDNVYSMFSGGLINHVIQIFYSLADCCLFDVSKKTILKSLSIMVGLAIIFPQFSQLFPYIVRGCVTSYICSSLLFLLGMLWYWRISRINHFSSLFMLFALNSTSHDTEIAHLVLFWLFPWNAIFIPTFSSFLGALVYVAPLKPCIIESFL